MKSEDRAMKEDRKSDKGYKKLHIIQDKTTQFHNLNHFVVVLLLLH
jgi:hypothetical protein